MYGKLPNIEVLPCSIRLMAEKRAWALNPMHIKEQIDQDHERSCFFYKVLLCSSYFIKMLQRTKG